VPATLATGCDLDYPEVVVVNRIAADVVIRDPSFNGCRWNVTLNFGDTTIPKRCLPGDDRVHFQKLDLGKYADDLAAAGTDVPEPMWFNYQTVSVKRVGEGDFRVFDVTADDLEQDFSIPGPYGH
jgi:hypothetical protein